MFMALGIASISAAFLQVFQNPAGIVKNMVFIRFACVPYPQCWNRGFALILGQLQRQEQYYYFDNFFIYLVFNDCLKEIPNPFSSGCGWRFTIKLLFVSSGFFATLGFSWISILLMLREVQYSFYGTFTCFSVSKRSCLTNFAKLQLKNSLCTFGTIQSWSLLTFFYFFPGTFAQVQAIFSHFNQLAVVYIVHL